MILPMGEQRKKNLAEPQPGTAGLDEVKPLSTNTTIPGHNKKFPTLQPPTP